MKSLFLFLISYFLCIFCIKFIKAMLVLCLLKRAVNSVFLLNRYTKMRKKESIWFSGCIHNYSCYYYYYFLKNKWIVGFKDPFD